MNHTPGPWRVIERDGLPTIVQRRGSGGFAVLDDNPARALADAKLIAAAPDLLAALQEINNIAMAHPYAGNTCGDVARAALAKVSA